MRTRDELNKDFLASGEPDFLVWLRKQPEGDPGGKVVSSATQKFNPHREQFPAKMPSKMQMARNLYRAVKQAVKSGAKLVSSQERKRRRKICESNECGFYITEAQRCAKCGCWTTFKTNLAAWHCPIEKW